MIAPSFADIFYNNSLNNHMLPIRLSEEEVEEIFQWVWANESKQIHVDLEAMTVTVGDKVYTFELDEFRRHCLLNGLDNIGLTLQHEDKISAYEKKYSSVFTLKIKKSADFSPHLITEFHSKIKPCNTQGFVVYNVNSNRLIKN